MSHPNGQDSREFTGFPLPHPTGIQVPKSLISRRKNPVLFPSWLVGILPAVDPRFSGILEHSPSFQGDPAFPRCPHRPGGRKGAGIATTGDPKATDCPAGNGAGGIPCLQRFSNLFIPPSGLGAGSSYGLGWLHRGLL